MEKLKNGTDPGLKDASQGQRTNIDFPAWDGSEPEHAGMMYRKTISAFSDSLRLYLVGSTTFVDTPGDPASCQIVGRERNPHFVARDNPYI